MLGYQDKSDLVPEGSYLFSVTSISKYITDSNSFFKAVIDKEKEEIQTESTVIGTIIHHAIECTHSDTPLDDEEIRKYITDNSEKFNLDSTEIFKRVYDTLPEIDNYYGSMKFNPPSEYESNHILKLTDRVYIGGTLDARYGDRIIDYKTTKVSSSIGELPQHYIRQLSTYAYILIQEGLDITSGQIDYIHLGDIGRVSSKTGKALKNYYPYIETKYFYITDEMLRLVESNLKLIADSIEFILDNKDNKHLIYREIW